MHVAMFQYHLFISMKRSKDQSSYAAFVQCLLHMAVGTFEDSFFNYAKRWLDSINRGGAFELGDSAYSFFLVIEEKFRVHLKAL